MKRTSVILSDETAARLHQVARLNGTSQAEVIRDAIEAKLEQDASERRELSFIGIYDGGDPHASTRVDEIVGAALAERYPQ